jgi:hypothetical protein
LFGIEIIEEERCKNKMFFELLKFLQNLGFGVNLKKVYKTPPGWLVGKYFLV